MLPDLEIRAQPSLFIDGQWVEAADGGFLDAVCPATGEVITRVQSAGAQDVDAAVRAAHAAFEQSWRQWSTEDRYGALMELANRVEANRERLAMIEVTDTGSTIGRMLRDMDSAARLIRMYAGLARLLRGTTVPVSPQFLAYTVREPFGVVSHIIPFNHPLMFAAQAIGVALAAGNCVVLKPSEYTPLTSLELAELSTDLIPAGVINVLTGFGPTCGAPMVEHELVKKVFFRGSVPVGRMVGETCARRGVPYELELGGKNPFVVFPDADVAAAVKGAVTGLNLGHQGQSCGAATRLFVHDDVYEAFRSGLVEEFSRVKVGLPWEPDTQMGAMVSREQYERVLDYFAIAQGEGARTLAGGVPSDDPKLSTGLFVQPTIFEVDDPGARIASEEVFGPVTCLIRWKDEDRLIESINALDYGLTASVWTNDLTTAHDMSGQIEAGVVWVNQHGPRPSGVPFGGFKGSGTGKELSIEEIEAYTHEKLIMVAIDRD